MDDKQGSHQKQPKPTANKIKDLYNAYIRNEGSRTIPVVSGDNVKSENVEIENEKPETDELSGRNEFIPEDALLVKKDDLENLVKRNEELENENEDLKDQVLRKTAEMENFRRRTLLEKQQMIDYGNERLLSRFLDISDDFTNAIDAGSKSTDYDSLLTGLDLIYQKVIKFLADFGVSKMENSVGKPFDVHFHEAVMMIPSELPEGFVVQEIQTGYMILDKVLRHAKVITSSGMPKEE